MNETLVNPLEAAIELLIEADTDTGGAGTIDVGAIEPYAAALSALALVEISKGLHEVTDILQCINESVKDLHGSFDKAHKQGDWHE